MARTYARVKTGIWADDDFRALPIEAQHLYFVLLTSNSLNYCGVTDWRPVRIAASAGGWTPSNVAAAGGILAKHRYVVIDEDTEEVLIRSFVRNDGFMAQLTVAAALVRAYGQVASSNLRGVVVHELNRLHKDHPEYKGWASAGVLLENPSVDPFDLVTNDPVCDPISHPISHPLSDPSTDTGLTLVVTPSLPTPSPTPSPTPPTGEIGSRKRAIQRPSDWAPNQQHVSMAEQLELDLAREVAQFADHHDSKGSAFKDWDASFRTWLRNAAKWGGSKRNPYSKQQATDDLFDAAYQRALIADRNQQELSS